jgi:class 3 adenylate cyclase
MPKRFVTPQLADLRQDIAGQIPLDVVRDWMQSQKDLSAQTEILSAYRKPGCVVSSDSSGLTKLGRERPLLEVMKLVNDPKQILHSYGSAIGGTAVGVWAADNSEMFYGEGVEPRQIMEQMIAAQREIAKQPLQVGMAIHSGEFLLIGGGAFGPDADLVEALAEDYSGAREIVVTPSFRSALEGCAFQGLGFAPKGDTGAFVCDYGGAPPAGIRGTNIKYPFPFTEEFFSFLQEYGGPASTETRRILDRYERESVVVLLKVRNPGGGLLLDQLTNWVLANAIIAQVTREDRVTTVKSNGSLGIFLADTPDIALDFATDLRSALDSNGYDFNIGMAGGSVMVFPMNDASGQQEIAGEPVNLASKICEDVEERDAIYIDESVARRIKSIPGGTPFQLAVSHVEIKGVKLAGPQPTVASA